MSAICLRFTLLSYRSILSRNVRADRSHLQRFSPFACPACWICRSALHVACCICCGIFSLPKWMQAGATQYEVMEVRRKTIQGAAINNSSQGTTSKGKYKECDATFWLAINALYMCCKIVMVYGFSVGWTRAERSGRCFQNAPRPPLKSPRWSKPALYLISTPSLKFLRLLRFWSNMSQQLLLLIWHDRKQRSCLYGRYKRNKHGRQWIVLSKRLKRYYVMGLFVLQTTEATEQRKL